MSKCISKEDFKNLKILLSDMSRCSTKENKWIAQRRQEEIEGFLFDLTKKEEGDADV